LPEHAATLSFSYPSVERARSVAAAVEPEAGDIEGGRTVARVSRSGRVVSVAVEAGDLTALRAGTNTWNGLVGTAERVAEGTEQPPSPE